MRILTTTLMALMITTSAHACDPKVQEIKALYNELMAFKDDESFKECGFGACGHPDWLRQVEALREHDWSLPKRLRPLARLAVVRLDQLGLAYVQSRGAEREDTRVFRGEVDHYLRRLNDE